MKTVYTLFRSDSDLSVALENLRMNLHPMPSKNELIRILTEHALADLADNPDTVIEGRRWVGEE